MSRTHRYGHWNGNRNETTMKVHSRLALENGATLDEIFEVIRIIFFYLRRHKAPAHPGNLDMFEPIDEN